MQLSNAKLLEKIERISADGLDPMHSRQTLVRLMINIYKLAASAESESQPDGKNAHENLLPNMQTKL